MHDWRDIAEVLVWSAAGIKAAFGGLVGYLIDIRRKQEPFSWIAYCVFFMAAFLVGLVLGDWLPATTPGRDGIIMVAGTAAYPILDAMQERVIKIINGLGDRKDGIN